MAVAMTSYDYFAHCNDYWKSEQHLDAAALSATDIKKILAARGYYVASSTNREELRRHLCRSDRGQTSYANLSNHELKALIEARDLSAPTGPSGLGSRSDLLLALQIADNHPRFVKVMHLSAEVRCRIYDYYFADFKDKPLHAPTQPPLTITNRLIRQETLPIFYGTCSFAINLLAAGSVNRPYKRLNIPMETYMWLHGSKAKDLAGILRLQIAVENEDSTGPLFTIHLDSKDIKDFKMVTADGGMPSPLNVKRWEGLLEVAKDVFKEFAGEKRKRKGLTSEQAFKARNGIEDAMRK